MDPNSPETPDTNPDPIETPEDKVRAKSRTAVRELFIECLAGGATLGEAAAICGIGRVTSWNWRQDPEYAARCAAAVKESLPTLEETAYRRALNGSDKLLIFLLQARDPAKYNLVQKVEHSVDADLANRILKARRRTGAEPQATQDDGLDLL